MLFPICKGRYQHKLFFKVITFFISSHWIILSSGCISSNIQSEKKSELKISETNAITVVQSTSTKSNVETTSSNKQNDKEDTEDYDVKIESFKKNHSLEEYNNNMPESKICSTIEKLINQSSTIESIYIADQNKTSTCWFKVISKYFILSEKATSYLGLEHELDGFQIANHTIYSNITKHTPVFIVPNFSHNQSMSFELDGNYFWSSNISLTEENLNKSINFNRLKFIYPPWHNLNDTEKDMFLQLAQGSSRRHGKSASMGLTFYFIILLCIGIPGNLLTCCIILTNSYMRTAPNFFLLNILIADIFTLILGKLISYFLVHAFIHFVI